MKEDPPDTGRLPRVPGRKELLFLLVVRGGVCVLRGRAMRKRSDGRIEAPRAPGIE